jgi:hypothetical protein
MGHPHGSTAMLVLDNAGESMTPNAANERPKQAAKAACEGPSRLAG